MLSIPGSSPSPYFSPLKSGLVALSAEISQHGDQSVQDFHRNLSRYFSIIRHHSLQKIERCILSTRIPFNQAFHSNLRCKNCRQQLASKWKAITIRRGTLPVSGVYLNNFPFIICLTPGPLHAVDMTFKAFQKASNFLLLDSVFPLAEGLGVGLFQKTGKGFQPVHYVSRTLTVTEKRYSQIEREALAAEFTTTRLQMYLLGAPKFQLATDHKPLLPLFNS